MSSPQTLFWNKQIQYFESQAVALSEQFNCELVVGEMRFDGHYCYIDVSCDNTDVVNLLKMKMINFQFYEMANFDEILVEVSQKIQEDVNDGEKENN